MKKVLSIAGSDCSGGAGIQADLKTFMAHGKYGMSVITALTAQNTTGVKGIMEASPEFVRMQLDAVFTDIRPDSVKVGMASSIEIIEAVAERLAFYNAINVVVDPVMIATSGRRLLNDDALDALKRRLVSMADVITPNIPEAEYLCGFPIRSREDMEKAARLISGTIRGAVLIKGGHLEDSADDLLYDNGKIHVFRSPRIDNPNTHGTGCTLSSAIACNLADGHDISSSIGLAKSYITGAIDDGLGLGCGSGPLNHAYNISPYTGKHRDWCE